MSFRTLIIACVTAGLASAFTFLPASANPDRWRAQGWKTDFTKSDINFSDILSGGPPKDGIPSIDKPTFGTVSDNDTLGMNEPVIQLDINGDVRAYPLGILTWHEIVNDVVGGVPVAVTYCPLCNASIVFDRRIGDEVLEFGTTGKLRNSDLVMYDRGSESWWQQFTGEAIVGKHLGSELTMLPVRVVSFSSFAKDHPDGKVLVPNSPNLRSYGRNPYVNYDSRRAPYPLFKGELPTDINPMARVIVFRDGDKQRAITMAKLRQSGETMLGDVKLSWRKGVASALDAAIIDEGRDVGAVSVTRMIDGKSQDVVHDVTFAFVFHAFHPNGELLQ